MPICHTLALRLSQTHGPCLAPMEGGAIIAGDWIKIEHVTPFKPEVDRIAEALDMPADQVVGILLRLWIWADQQTLDGNATGVTVCAIERHAGVTGFAAAMQKAGWLRVNGAGIVFPNFERHNGETAKGRALTAKRVTRHRRGKCNATIVTQALPEKRREEKKKKKPPQPPLDGGASLAAHAERIEAAYEEATGKPMPQTWRRAIKREWSDGAGDGLLATITTETIQRGQKLQKRKGGRWNWRFVIAALENPEPTPSLPPEETEKIRVDIAAEQHAAMMERAAWFDGLPEAEQATYRERVRTDHPAWKDNAIKGAAIAMAWKARETTP